MRTLLLSVLITGCTDYAFNKGSPEPNEPDGPPPDTFDTGIPDSGAPPTDTADTHPTDSGTPTDACFEPEDGYAQNPAARIVATGGSMPVTVTLVSSDTDYDDNLRLEAPASRQLMQAWQDAPGTQATLGPYSAETELIFGILVLDTGEEWQSGPSTRNGDGVVHVAVTYEGDCSWLIGFEDLTGGGDLDYNDVVMRVQGRLRQDD